MTVMPFGDSSPISLALLVLNFLFWLWVTIKVGLRGRNSSIRDSFRFFAGKDASR